MSLATSGGFTPNDWIELIKTVFSGLATLLGAIAAAYAIIAAQRAKRAEASSKENKEIIKEVKQQTDGVAAKMQELGEAIGEKRGRQEKSLEMREAAQYADQVLQTRSANDAQIAKALEEAKRAVDAVAVVPVLAPVDVKDPEGEVKVVEALAPLPKGDKS